MHSLGKIQQSFQRALQSYNGNASFQRAITKRLFDLALDAQLPTDLNRALEIGCGTGFLTQQFTSKINTQQLFINDLVADCEDYIQKIIPAPTQWLFLTGNIEEIDIPEQLDLISSASTLQWVKDLRMLLQQLTQQLNPGGYLVLSSFADDHFKEIRSLQIHDKQNTRYPMSYWSADQWHSALQADYDVLTIQSEIQTAFFDSTKELLMHLRLTGVNGNARQRWTQQKLNRFAAAYAEQFQVNGKLKLSYNPVYIIAKKKPTKNISEDV